MNEMSERLNDSEIWGEWILLKLNEEYVVVFVFDFLLIKWKEMYQLQNSAICFPSYQFPPPPPPNPSTFYQPLQHLAQT